jgi:biofilm PGA synthesis N-glycosyltransferase PgaC
MGVVLTYAVITPARNEADQLERLAAELGAQTVRPAAWVVVDDNSADETTAIAARVADRALTLDDGAAPARGRDAIAFQAGLELLEPHDVVIKLDADVSVEPGHFEGLLAAFAGDDRLGIASGTAYEQEDERWVSRNVTGSSVWGAARAYRRACLDEVLPFEARVGWDGVDELRANARGWTTRTLPDLPFRHLRPEGQREQDRRAMRSAQGEAAWYMGYSPLYLTLRALHHARREPAALAMIAGYAGSAIRRQPRSDDDAARAYLRRQQSVRNLWARRREATRPPERL